MGATSPLYDLLNQIKQASDTKLYLLSLTAVVALPDICVSLESTEGRSNGVAYRAWCAANVGGVFPFITPDDLYSMRCGVVHNGTLSGMKHDVKRVIFVPPAGVSIVGNIAGDAYIYSAVEFCQTFCIAVHDWYEANRERPIVKANSERMMQYRVDGLAPYIFGATVIA